MTTPTPAEPTTKAIEAKHTPGPWHVSPPTSQNPSRAAVVAMSGFTLIYEAPLTMETEANARLIAAAPDLLAACESAIETLKRLQADGYLDNGGPSVPGSAEPEWPWYLSKFETDAKAAIAKAKGGVA